MHCHRAFRAHHALAPIAQRPPSWVTEVLQRWYRFIAVLLMGALTGCSLPPIHGRSDSLALDATETQHTRLGKGIEQLREQANASRDLTGYYSLSDAQDAFAARALLARAADRSLDIQNYIWRGDVTGNLLVHELIEAADRGVRVRLLLDDNGTSGIDDTLQALDSHALIEVRLFNPFVLRWPKPLGYLTDFSRLNRRMHNKSFTADNQASIVGGRNVGNEYFGATDGVLFSDLDLLAVGAVVHDISSDFDRYWASASSYPVDRIITRAPRLDIDTLRAQGLALQQSPEARLFGDTIAETPFIEHLTQAQLPLEWAPARLVSDDPAKGLGQAKKRELIGAQITRALGSPHTTLDLVSAYFVPTQEGVEGLGQLSQQGVRLRVLTNSVEATDVIFVHAGYAKYRKALLRKGIELYELRKQTPVYASTKDKRLLSMNRFGSSGSSLHAKTFAVDGERVFVGSFNFDPRSMALNTEMGILVDSPKLAAEMTKAFDESIPAMAYRVVLGPDDQLQWHSGVGDPPPVYTTEPDMGLLRRAVLWLVGILPIEWLL